MSKYKPIPKELHKKPGVAATDCAVKFAKHVSPSDQNGCKLWTGGKIYSGYGRMNCLVNGKWTLQLAHRVAWELFCGTIPAGMCVLHTCDVRNCVNPDHLFLGTQGDNIKDTVSKGHCPSGESHFRAKITAAQVKEIRAAVAAGETQAAMAVRFGLTPRHVWKIVARRLWRRV